jgi:hypothetical protein
MLEMAAIALSKLPVGLSQPTLLPVVVDNTSQGIQASGWEIELIATFIMMVRIIGPSKSFVRDPYRIL